MNKDVEQLIVLANSIVIDNLTNTVITMMNCNDYVKFDFFVRNGRDINNLPFSFSIPKEEMRVAIDSIDSIGLGNMKTQKDLRFMASFDEFERHSLAFVYLSCFNDVQIDGVWIV